MNNIGILGCGWIGIPLSKLLIKKGYSIKGTATSIEKTQSLIKLGIKSYCYYLNNKDSLNSNFFKSIDVLVITIPFVKKNKKLNNLEQLINKLVKIIENESIQHVIYLSSISVYDSLNGVIDESIKCKPKSYSGIQTLIIEKLILKGNFISTIIRLGGLIGGNRHPIHFLSGNFYYNGEELINLIHQDDVLAIILKIIENKNNEDFIFNAVAPFHPSKKDYYSMISSKMKIAPPRYIKTKNIKKIINSKKVQEKYNFTFKRKDLLP